MEQFLGYLPKLVVTVGLLYFAFNPLFRHQNTIHLLDLTFIAGGILIVSWYTEVMIYREVAWILGAWTGVFLGSKIAFFFMKRGNFILFNVFRKDAPSLEIFLKDSAEAAGLAPSEWHYSPKYPFWVGFRSGNRPGMKKVVKETENFIRKHLPISFWSVWIWMMVVLILIASLWRF